MVTNKLLSSLGFLLLTRNWWPAEANRQIASRVFRDYWKRNSFNRLQKCYSIPGQQEADIWKMKNHLPRKWLNLWLSIFWTRSRCMFSEVRIKVLKLHPPEVTQTLAERLHGIFRLVSLSSIQPCRELSKFENLKEIFQNTPPGIYQSVAGRSSSQGLNLNRSQFGGCSTKYNTLAGT